jgi:ribosomal protein S16
MSQLYVDLGEVEKGTKVLLSMNAVRKRDAKAIKKLSSFDPQYQSLQLEQLKVKLESKTLAESDDIGVLFTVLYYLKRQQAQRDSESDRKTFRVSSSTRESQIFQFFPVSQLFQLLVGVMEFAIMNDCDYLHKFTEQRHLNVATIENHLKELPLPQKMLYRRLVAFAIFKAGKHKKCYNYIKSNFVHFHKDQDWTFQLMSLIYSHLPMED